MAAEIGSASDQKKLIAAVGLGVVALIALYWTFVGFGSSSKPTVRNTATGPSASPSPAQTRSNQRPPQGNEAGIIDLAQVTAVPVQISLPQVPEPRRNIFAFYEPKPTPLPVQPSPTPTPTPPLLLASISPSNVYAKTEDFSLEARGDKFSPAVAIVIDGRPFTTRYISPQQVSTTVPAAIIANPGQRQVIVRSSDNTLYSLPLSLSISPAPTPNFTYIGIIGKHRNIGDTALLRTNRIKRFLVFNAAIFWADDTESPASPIRSGRRRH
jgi:hypothetical protein